MDAAQLAALITAIAALVGAAGSILALWRHQAGRQHQAPAPAPQPPAAPPQPPAAP